MWVKDLQENKILTIQTSTSTKVKFRMFYTVIHFRLKLVHLFITLDANWVLSTRF